LSLEKRKTEGKKNDFDCVNWYIRKGKAADEGEEVKKKATRHEIHKKKERGEVDWGHGGGVLCRGWHCCQSCMRFAKGREKVGKRGGKPGGRGGGGGGGRRATKLSSRLKRWAWTSKTKRSRKRVAREKKGSWK